MNAMRKVWLVAGLALAACDGTDEIIPPVIDAPDTPPIDAPSPIDAVDAISEPLMCVPSVTSLTVAEGATGVIAYTLSGQPPSAVTLTIASSDANAATVAPATLTFTAANFATPQTVTVSGVQDANMMDEVATVACTGTGIPAATVAVTVTDDD